MELKRIQTPNLEIKFVKVKFQGLNPIQYSTLQKLNTKLLLLLSKLYISILKEILIFPLYYMAKLYFPTHTLDLNTPLPFRLYTLIIITNISLHSFILTFTSTIPITPTNTDNYLPTDDANITNVMVSHYDCRKQHKLRQFILNK